MALFSFSAEGPGELSISEGDQLEVIEMVDSSWLKGRLGGKEGIFPADFVEVKGDIPVKESGSKKVGGDKTSSTKGLCNNWHYSYPLPSL